MAIFFIKLCNFAASQTDLTEEMLNWLNVLKNMPDMDESDYDKQPAFFQDLLDECRISKLTAMEKDNYQKSVLEYEDVKRAVAYAKETAAKDAYEEGLNVGMEKGREEAKLFTAKKFLALGVPVATVAQATGFSIEEIERLRDEIQ